MLTTITRKPALTRVLNVLEYAASGTARIDEQKNIIFGVKVVGLESLNKRRYKLEAIRKAANLYEDADVFVNHVRAGDDRRGNTYGERFGSIKNFRVEKDGGYADLHYNPFHPKAAQVIHDIKTTPNKIGLSHHADITESGGMPSIVESIDKVHSVDIVRKPATTKGIFEGVSEDFSGVSAVPGEQRNQGGIGSDKQKPAPRSHDDGAKVELQHKVLAAFQGEGDYRQALAKLRKILADIDNATTTTTESAPDNLSTSAAVRSFVRGVPTIEYREEKARAATDRDDQRRKELIRFMRGR
jgi:hypothetical protein